MADALVRLKVESQEYDAKIKRAQEGLTRYADECRKCGVTLEYVEKETLEYVKFLGQMDTVSKSAKGKVAELSNAYTELAVQYKQLTDAEKASPYGQALQGSLEQLKGRITELKGNLSDAAGELAGPNGFGKIAESIHLPKEALGQLGQAFGSLGPAASGAMSMLPKLMSPVGAAIAAIVLAVKELIGAFKRNEDAMTAVQKIAAPFKAVWQSIQRLFDDIVRIFVDVYSHLENVAGGFSGFKVILSPVAAAIAAVRASLAIVGTVLTDIAKAVELVSGKVRSAMQGSTVSKFFQGITDTIQGFFTKFTGWVDKIANSALGKKLGLDTLAVQLKQIITSQNELTASNKKIAESENALNKIHRQNIELNSADQLKIAKLRADAAEKDKYNAAERVKMLRQAGDLEEAIMKRNVDEAKKELEVIRLKNSLTESGTEDRLAESQAIAKVNNAEREYFEKKRAIQRQLQAAINEDNKDKKTAAKVEVPVEPKVDEKTITQKIKEAFEKAKAEYLQGTGSQEMYLDAQMAMNLQSVVDKNGLQGINIPIGVEVTDEEWATLVEQINEQLEMLGIDPIKIGVETEGADVAQLAKDGDNAKASWQGATQAVSAVSGALQQIDDPGAKIAGTIGMAIAQIAGGLGSMLAQPQSTAQSWGWIALAASGAATMISTIAAVKSATAGYAEGGMVLPNGNPYGGDNIVARLNAGEGVLTARGVANAEAVAGQLQQGSYANSGMNINVNGRVSGKDIILSSNNYSRSAGKGTSAKIG